MLNPLFAQSDSPSIFFDMEFLAQEGSGIGPVFSIGLDRHDKRRPKNRHLDIISYSIGSVGAVVPNRLDFGGDAYSIGYEKRYQLNVISYKRHCIFLMTGLKGNIFRKDYNWFIDENGYEVNPKATAYEATLTAGLGVGYRFNSKNGVTVSFTPLSAYWGYANRISSWKHCEYATPIYSPEILGGRVLDIELSVPLELILK